MPAARLGGILAPFVPKSGAGQISFALALAAAGLAMTRLPETRGKPMPTSLAEIDVSVSPAPLDPCLFVGRQKESLTPAFPPSPSPSPPPSPPLPVVLRSLSFSLLPTPSERVAHASVLPVVSAHGG